MKNQEKIKKNICIPFNKWYLYIIAFTFIYPINVYSQSNPIKVIHNKIKNIKKQDSLTLSGKINGYAGYKLFDIKNENNFDYRINATINISYMGLKIPISYNFSNGRSISRINLPNYRTPKFNTLGISPTYKWAKVHIGNNRSMSFSEFTYQNVRFKGGGIELTPGKFELKSFKGDLILASINDLSYKNNIQSEYARPAWGLMTGYNEKKTKLHAIIFKTNDKISNFNIINKKVVPKANTALGLKGETALTNNFNIEFDYGLSALTKNSFSDTIDILTGSTVYNMLGLYTKTATSIYRNAMKASIGYNLEKSNFKFNYVHIEKDYRTLGSLMYDNNYSSYTVSYSGTILKKLTLSNEIGLRYDGFMRNKEDNGRKIVFNSSVSYLLNESVSFNSNYSNFRKTSRLYHQNLNTFNFDSISLALVNSNFNISSNIMLGEDKKSLINIMFSTQNSNTIQHDSVYYNNEIKNKMFSISYNRNNEKSTLNATISYISNKSNSFKSYSILPNINFNYSILDNLSIKNSLSFNYIYANKKGRKQLLFNNGLEYKYNKKNSLIFNTRTNFTDTEKKFKLFEIFCELTVNSSF